MKQKKPDIIVWSEEKGWYAKSLPYASDLSSPPIKPNNITSWKQTNIGQANKYFESRFNELIHELKFLKEEYEWSNLIYNSKFNFEPIIGETYYLYKNTHNNFLSIIKPTEWGSNTPDFIGEFRFDSKNKWTKIS